MKTRGFMVAALVVVAMITGACTTSPPTRYYTLQAERAQSPVGKPLPDTTLVVAPVDLPDYLDRPQLVIRNGDGRVELQEFDRWGEALDDGFTRVLVENLSRLTGSSRIFFLPYPDRQPSDYRLLARVSRFEVDADQTANLEVQWTIQSGTKSMVVPTRRSTYDSRGAGPGGSAAVMAMSALVAEFAADVDRALRETVAP